MRVSLRRLPGCAGPGCWRDAVLRVPLILLALSCLYSYTESETSYTWRLDIETGKVIPGVGHHNLPQSASSSGPGDSNRFLVEESEISTTLDVMMNILMSTELTADGTWRKTWESARKFCTECLRSGKEMRDDSIVRANGHDGLPVEETTDRSGSSEGSVKTGSDLSSDPVKDDILDCGKPVNFTYYDHLVGIQNRASHPHIPEPDVALTFNLPSGKSGSKSKKYSAESSTAATYEVNIDAIERKLKRVKREKPKSVELYNQIGNFWRIRGDTQKSIECFRRALAVSPNNAEILLNLARVLFNLQYLDDAIFLTRRSLEVQPPDQNPWAQHFQLGEILKAYCHYQEAALHLRHVLELKPDYVPALSALADMESMPNATVHVYTIIIIVCLVLAVLLWVLSTLDISLEVLLYGNGGDSKSGISTLSNGHSKSNRFQRLQHSKSNHHNGKRSG